MCLVHHPVPGKYHVTCSIADTQDGMKTEMQLFFPPSGRLGIEQKEWGRLSKVAETMSGCLAHPGMGKAQGLQVVNRSAWAHVLLVLFSLVCLGVGWGCWTNGLWEEVDQNYLRVPLSARWIKGAWRLLKYLGDMWNVDCGGAWVGLRDCGHPAKWHCGLDWGGSGRDMRRGCIWDLQESSCNDVLPFLLLHLIFLL